MNVEDISREHSVTVTCLHLPFSTFFTYEVFDENLIYKYFNVQLSILLLNFICLFENLIVPNGNTISKLRRNRQAICLFMIYIILFGWIKLLKHFCSGPPSYTSLNTVFLNPSNISIRIWLLTTCRRLTMLITIRCKLIVVEASTILFLMNKLDAYANIVHMWAKRSDIFFQTL